MANRLTYLLCSTPRSGSTMLCSLLRSSGVAGRPESYFREPDEAIRAARWGIRHDRDLDYAAFVQSAVAAGSTPNGVVGVRVMWGTIEHIVGRLKPSYGTDSADDAEILQRAFQSPLTFLYLRREDQIGQAVSWTRAEQTGYWHPGDATAASPHFNFDQIDGLVRTVGDHNEAWRSWFDRLGIQPYEISYEQLACDPVGTTWALLEHLGLDVADADDIEFDDKRQADSLNAAWITRYRAELR